MKNFAIWAVIKDRDKSWSRSYVVTSYDKEHAVAFLKTYYRNNEYQVELEIVAVQELTTDTLGNIVSL